MYLEACYFCFSEKCRLRTSERFSKIERKLNRILHLLENGEENKAEIQKDDFSLLPNFSLTTVNKIQAFNEQLNEANVRRQFVSILLFTNYG